MIDRYGAAVEADLLWYTHGAVDLLDFFRGVHSWRRLFRLMSTWDADSRFSKAQADDPEYARLQVEELVRTGEENVAKWRPRPIDWTQDREMLAMVWDRLGALASLVSELPSAVKTRRPPPELFPRPITEIDRQRAAWRELQDRAYQNRIEDLVARGQARWRERVERGENPYGDGTPSLQIVQDGDTG